MAKFKAIALTSFQDALRRKTNYAVWGLMLLIVLIFVGQQAVMSMARRSGERELIAQMIFGILTYVMSLWRSAGFVMGIILGATTLSSEVSSKTIVNILTRPVDRGMYAFARWSGVALYLFAFSLVGLVLALVGSAIAGISWPLAVWVQQINYLLTPLLWSAIVLSLSCFMSPVLAGVLPLLLALAPNLLGELVNNPHLYVRAVAVFFCYLPPAATPGNLSSQSFSSFVTEAPLSLYLQVYLEHILYAAAALAIGGAYLRRRELKLR